MDQTTPAAASQSASTSESKPLAHKQHQINIEDIDSSPPQRRLNLPCYDLINGPREDYLRMGLPLYEACIRCDLKAAKAIIERRPELVRYSITENGETALHLVATVKRSSKQVEMLVKFLVDMMGHEDLELVNKNHNTAFYLAVAAGNLETIKIMMRRNAALPTIIAANGQMMPLYAAALFGNYEVAKYLYNHSKDLSDDGWNLKNRGWLLEKCVEADMLDVALQIVKAYPELGSTGPVLLTLARKPEAFYYETASNIIKRRINSVFSLLGLTVGAYEMESKALLLLRIIWENIARKPRNEIDSILRGPPDPENLIHALPLQKLIYEHLGILDAETKNIMGGPPLDKSLKLHQLFSDHLENIDVETKKLVKEDHMRFFRNYDRTSLELQMLIHDHVVNIRFEFHNIIKKVSKEEEEEDEASCLQELILKHITKMRALTGLNRKKYSSRILFIAAEMGNTKFLIELIRRYPDLMWKVNDENQTIFHVAVKYRHEGIYTLLYEIGSMKDIVTSMKDEDNNNMLHLAGKMTTKRQHAFVSGAALQMQDELLWFMEVRNIIPPTYRERKNKDGLTPAELFLEEHKELIREGEKWMKETSSQFIVAAALIATIAFAAAFTVPGGYNQDNGIPIFYRKPIFPVFVVADAMSLLLSSTSILTFLSIFTSRYSQFDFVESLPKKLMVGMSSLFLSITTMIITFSVSFFIVYHKEMIWIPVFIGAFALMPILLYTRLQYQMLIELVRSTYGSKSYKFKPKKQSLYYVNPKF